MRHKYLQCSVNLGTGSQLEDHLPWLSECLYVAGWLIFDAKLTDCEVTVSPFLIKETLSRSSRIRDKSSITNVVCWPFRVVGNLRPWILLALLPLNSSTRSFKFKANSVGGMCPLPITGAFVSAGES